MRLYPSEVTQICAEQQFELTCSTNETGLVWDLDDTISDSQDQLQYLFFSSDPDPAIRQLQVGSTMLILVRNSTRNSLSLVSSLSVINASSSINGKKVNCTELIMNTVKGQVKSTTFHTIGANHNGSYI